MLFLKLAASALKIWQPPTTTHKNISYGKHPEQTLDAYLLSDGAFHPAIVFIHGGGWQEGDKFVYEGRAKKWNAAGFHVFALNYRLAKMNDTATQWPAQLTDCQSALTWLWKNAQALKFFTHKTAVAGDSAGAHLAMSLSAAHCSLIIPAAVLNMFGPSDLTRPPFPDLLKSLAIFGGKTYADCPLLYKNASPLYSITHTFPPTCSIHGTADATVPITQAYALHARLSNMKVPNKLLTYDGGHEFADLSLFAQFNLEMQSIIQISEFLGV